MRANRTILCALVAATLAGCALKSPPTHDELASTTAPNRVVPPQWTASGAVSGEVSDGWLASFNDSQLNALALEALIHNPDLQIAAARVEQALAYQRVAGGTLYPQVNLLARGGGQLGGDASGLQGVGVFVNWELDLWGRVRAGAASAESQYASAALDAQFARQSIVAQVAKGWFLATEAHLQKVLAEDTLRTATQLESLSQDRLRVGVGDEYEVAVAQANVNGLRDTVQKLDLAYQQALRSLEILAGRYPSAKLVVTSDLPPTPAPIPVGMPSALLERRPDVVAAERRVAASLYLTEQAKAARLPQISLTSTVTSVSSGLFVLQDRENPVWSAGASLLAPIFLGGQLKAQVEVRTAEQKQALADYGRIGARAFGEVENALSAVFGLDAREAILQRVVSDNTRALELANIRFRVGSSDLRSALQQNLTLFASQSTLLSVRSERLVQRVNLHLALGGSFDAKSEAQPVALESAAAR